MKNLITYFSKFAPDNGSGMHRLWTDNGPIKSRKLFALLALLLFVGVGSAWGTLSSPYECTFTSGMSMSGSNCTTGDVTWTVSTTTGKGSPTISFGNQNGQSCIKFGSGKSNYYSSMTLTTSAFSSYNVSSVVLYISSNNGGSKTVTVSQGATTIGTGSQSFSSTTWVTGCTRNTTAGSGGNLSVTISSDATATFIHYIKVTYSAPSCTIKPTVGSSLTSVSATVNSITATVPISSIGGCNITENGLVYSTSNSTPTVGGTGCTKVTVTACGSTAANKTVTISGLTCGQSYYVRGYATNTAGTSYTNVTTQSTSACPLYTVTLMDDSDTRTQASYGASVTLPSRAGCSGYTFAGWSTTYNANWTTTAPTIINAGSYTPTTNENLYPVYTKTEGGGSGFKLSLNDGGTDYYIGPKGSGAYMSAVTDEEDAVIFTFADGYLSFDDSGTKTYISSEGNNTTLTVQTTPTTATWTESGTTTYTYQSSATGSRYLGFNSGTDPVRFAPYGSTYAHVFTKHATSTTSYISVPNCCTTLGSINGSINFETVFEPVSPFVQPHKQTRTFPEPIPYPTSPYIYYVYIP